MTCFLSREPLISTGKEYSDDRDNLTIDVYPCFPRFDSYPQYACSEPTVWNEVMTTYHSYHTQVDPSEPLYFPGISAFSLFYFELNMYNITEFQSGAFNPWGSAASGI